MLPTKQKGILWSSLSPLSPIKWYSELKYDETDNGRKKKSFYKPPWHSGTSNCLSAVRLSPPPFLLLGCCDEKATRGYCMSRTMWSVKCNLILTHPFLPWFLCRTLQLNFWCDRSGNEIDCKKENSTDIFGCLQKWKAIVCKPTWAQHPSHAKGLLEHPIQRIQKKSKDITWYHKNN